MIKWCIYSDPCIELLNTKNTGLQACFAPKKIKQCYQAYVTKTFVMWNILGLKIFQFSWIANKF